MKPFIKHEGLVAALDRVNVDTDQIIPKQFLKRIERTGFADCLFFDWRFLADGTPNPEFELNQSRYIGASILLAGANFGCGSSREHAPWALNDYGFRAIIAPSFADIFFNNCFKNGMLPIRLSEVEVRDLFRRVAENEGYRLTVDLSEQMITGDDGVELHFDIDPFRKQCLLEGLDDIGLTLQVEDRISAYESHRRNFGAA
ncbi:MAG: 3-isopropylmalate dehydratase small subunit [Acidobacteria bacterium]|nr:3-isopropylmalate dehydratase small subunit [Acidobacteriota bacterium]MCW5967178.1 3-isopropylmalate dehydratase small subunit [Blastocatellales bacterium]